MHAPRTAAEHAGIALVDADARQTSTLFISTASHWRVRARTNTSGTTYSAAALESRRRARMAAAHQRDARRARRRTRAARAAAARVGGRRAGRDARRRWCGASCKAGRVGRELRELQRRHSLTERAPTPAGSNCCTSSSTRRRPRGVGRTSGRRGGDVSRDLGDVAVVVDRVDDRASRSRAHVRGRAWRARAATAGGPAAVRPRFVGELRARRRRIATGRLGFGRARLCPVVFDARPRASAVSPAASSSRPRRRLGRRPALSRAGQVASESSSASSMTLVSSACGSAPAARASAAAAGGSPAAAAASSSAAGRAAAAGRVSSCRSTERGRSPSTTCVGSQA